MKVQFVFELLVHSQLNILNLIKGFQVSLVPTLLKVSAPQVCRTRTFASPNVYTATCEKVKTTLLRLAGLRGCSRRKGVTYPGLSIQAPSTRTQIFLNPPLFLSGLKNFHSTCIRITRIHTNRICRSTRIRHVSTGLNNVLCMSVTSIVYQAQPVLLALVGRKKKIGNLNDCFVFLQFLQ